MYNGVGLQTPRGSGTTGHVQASKFLAKPRPSPSSPSPSPSEAGGMRKPNKDILEHDRKRQVELRLLVLRDALEEQGYTEAEIEARVDEARKAAEAEAAAEERQGFTDTQSHHAAEQKERQLQTMRTAFGLEGENVHKKGGL
ncbi:hypothetical protein BDA96_03G231200 [Sorghum bicolor]|uniref:CWF21 domain-containing protein n=2 Tax=Sorghum bicolor TaxID=4558 RepID=A0A921RE98_SORBI|nr:pre-mRNA-splicing factor CWC21 [Sorghum bicolor]KAG0538382.1 hypothetical protein BDA96_03G231200 [Sorghum bicolor]KXG32845.1 hypothetical protein SORBI_3003G213700 [Sorghum bicolor]|eukprot:XP_021310822.1 pre-mRNA-splicing factor CWC21 [Sorghum bicolor]